MWTAAPVRRDGPVQCPDCEAKYPNKGLPPLRLEYATGCFVEFDFSVSAGGKCLPDGSDCVPDQNGGCSFKVKATCDSFNPPSPCCPIVGALFEGAASWDLWVCDGTVRTLAAPTPCGTGPFTFRFGGAAPGCNYNPNGVTGPLDFSCLACP